ncbi:ankyrin [Apiospora hydei]|uniref:Ankyrin n=1 Tax=Apiospora hydei TaxID=1337664 RepID=A0ABR1V5B2_9PEZI
MKDENGNSLLHQAIVKTQEYPSLDAIELLLEAGCSISAANNAGDQPLHVWSQTEPCSLDIAHQAARLLTEKGAECSHQNLKGCNVLHLVTRSPQMLKAVLKYQATDIVTKAMESTDATGHTPF